MGEGRARCYDVRWRCLVITVNDLFCFSSIILFMVIYWEMDAAQRHILGKVSLCASMTLRIGTDAQLASHPLSWHVRLSAGPGGGAPE